MWSITGAVAGGLVAALLGALAAVAGWWPVAPVLVVLGILLGVLYERAAWRRRSWQLDLRTLELRHGVVFQQAASIPYHRIQQIDIERGPLDRLVGLAQLVVHTAAATSDGTLPGLAPGDAALIRGRLLDLAGVDDAV